MAGVLEFESTGEYRDERLYILESVRRQENKLDATLKEVVGAKLEGAKVRADLNEAHGRIRKLQKAKDDHDRRMLRMEIKAGSIATLAGVLAAGAIEFVKIHLFKK